MSDNEVLYAASLFSVTSLVALVWRWQRNGGRPPYSPGPRGYPLIGSVLDVPQKLLIWGGYSVIAQRYNTDVLNMKLFSKDFVILTSFEAICDLLERRSAIYSDRVSHLADVYDVRLAHDANV